MNDALRRGMETLRNMPAARAERAIDIETKGGLWVKGRWADVVAAEDAELESKGRQTSTQRIAAAAAAESERDDHE